VFAARYFSRLLGPAILCLLIGCATPGDKSIYPPPPGDPANKTIYLTAYKNHTGIVLDKSLAAPWLGALGNDFKESRFLEFGWGDLNWYQSEKRTSGMAWHALVVPTDSGLWVWALPGQPDHVFSEKIVSAIKLSDQGFIRIVQFINDSFTLDHKLRNQPLKKGTFRKSEYRIYRANGNYHAFRNCNNWTARALRTAGFPVGKFSGFSGKALLEKVKSEQKNLNKN
jgi:uncharacterized protein (TIGR02117 family)